MATPLGMIAIFRRINSQPCLLKKGRWSLGGVLGDCLLDFVLGVRGVWLGVFITVYIVGPPVQVGKSRRHGRSGGPILGAINCNGKLNLITM